MSDNDYAMVVAALLTTVLIALIVCSLDRKAGAAPIKAKKAPRRNKTASRNDDYSVIWLEQSKGYYKLEVSLKSDMARANMTAQIRYLQNVFDQVFVNFIGGYYMGYRMIITYGGKSTEFSDFGCFTPAKLILFLIEMGLKEAYQADSITIDLLDMY